MAHVARYRRTPGHGQYAPADHILTGRYACYGTYEASDGKWLAVGAIEPKFYANLCGALGAQRWIDHQLDDEVQDEIRADFARASPAVGVLEWVAELSGSRHPWPRC